MYINEKEMTQTASDQLINRSQMISIAWRYNLRISRSTIHRWANKPGFPLVVGLDGQALLYQRSQFIDFIKRKLQGIQDGIEREITSAN
jgi:predicted DNA-binding transcriptional regulator AlpA